MPNHAERITVAWLHEIKPYHWEASMRGIRYANWDIHSIQSRPRNEPLPWDGYDVGPFVWTVAPSHGANMMPLEKPCNSHFVILVMESRDDVLQLLRLLEYRETHPMTDDITPREG